MQIRFTSQPFADGHDLRDFIRATVADPGFESLDVVVAWAKRSGLSRLRDDLELLRARAGHTRLIVGIDEGGATRQGLELARLLFDSVYVFHDRSGRTFHPKVYAAWGDSAARMLVGSHNATAGGVYYNYEAGVECELVLPSDGALLTSVQDYVARLLADTGLCKELTDAVLAELLSNPRYKVGDEDARKKPSGAEKTPEDLDADIDVDGLPDPSGAPPSIFGGSTEPKKTDPGVGAGATNPGAKPAEKAPAKKAPGTAGTSTGSAPAGTSVAVQKRWFKKLSNSDAQHPPTTSSNVTGVLRLVQAGHPIDQTTYFRHDLFASLPWASTPKPRGVLEQTVVPFEVAINGVAHGTQNLRIDDAAYREAGQGNHTSVLHWDGLGPTLAAADYTGSFVVLERLANGAYRLEITPNDPGSGAFLA